MIEILRLGHRINRDTRISSHVALVARALNADKLYYTGQKDSSMEKSVMDVVDRFGGSFNIEYIKNYKDILKNKKIIHLTVYGMPLKDKITEIKSYKDILIIVGGEKVPGEIYNLADVNLSVGNQPHSEVAALGIFLYELSNSKFSEFKDANLRIIPMEKAKKIEKKT